MSSDWQKTLKLHELSRGPVAFRLEAGAEDRTAIARQLGLESLAALNAEITAKSWFDGVEILGRVQAVVGQICGVTLDPFEQPVDSRFEIRAVPANSPHAPPADGGVTELDLEAPDAPDVMAGDMIDITAYVIEQLALELDPFPRKPGATFSYEPPVEEISPFAALRKLNEPKP